VRDAAVRETAIRGAMEGVRSAGFEVVAHADCVLAGPKGNLEAFVYARRA
jgi:hypothetical protein